MTEVLNQLNDMTTLEFVMNVPFDTFIKHEIKSSIIINITNSISDLEFLCIKTPITSYIASHRDLFNIKSFFMVNDLEYIKCLITNKNHYNSYWDDRLGEDKMKYQLRLLFEYRKHIRNKKIEEIFN